MEKNNELFLKQNSIFGCLIGGTFIFASLFFLYTFNADLLTEFKNVTINTLKITGQNSPLFKMFEENVDVYFVPASIAFGELFNRIIVGAAFSLFIAGLVRRSKLPFNPQEF